MFNQLITSFFRSLRKDKGYSTINVLGFTIGMASFILIVLFVLFELSYDRFYEKSDRTYRLCIQARIGDTWIDQTYSSARNFTELRERFPEIEEGVKIVNLTDVVLKIGDRFFTEPTMAFADSTYFNVFDRQLNYGFDKTALNRPNTLAMSASGAQRFFGDKNPVGEVIEMDLPILGKAQFEVTAVYEDIPDNSHFHFDLIGSLVSFPGLINNQGWSANNFTTYFVLHPEATAEDLETKFEDYVINQFGADQYDEWTSTGNFWSFYLQPLTDIHLRSDLNGEFESNGNIRYIYIFSVIAFFVLVIAIINFVNISTARSIKRSREVGIRKIVGSSRSLLIGQFLVESVILTLFSLALAILAAKLILPWYNDWLNKELGFSLFTQAWIIPGLIVVGILIGILSGIYPALFLASFKPVRVLKAQKEAIKRGIGLRDILVIIQFAASIFLIIGTLMVNRQMQYLQNTDLGFDRDNLMVVRTPPSFAPQYDAFERELEKQSVIRDVESASGLPAYSFNNLGFRAEGVDESFTLNVFSGDFNLDQTLGLELVEGRFLNESFPTDSNAMLINESTVRTLKLEEPLKARFRLNSNNAQYLQVVGVVKDFHYESMHTEIRPLGIFHNSAIRNGLRFALVRFEPGSTQSAIEEVQKTWNRLMPGNPFVYSFLDDDLNDLYGNERQTGQVFMMLSILAIIVASLGLLGLAGFMVRQQTRHIAVRKVFGASAVSIVLLFVMKFSRWILVAFVVAAPIAWWIMNQWLQNFQYRTTLAWWLFPLACLVAWLVAFFTIVATTSKAAQTNPAISLQYE